MMRVNYTYRPRPLWEYSNASAAQACITTQFAVEIAVNFLTLTLVFMLCLQRVFPVAVLLAFGAIMLRGCFSLGACYRMVVQTAGNEVTLPLWYSDLFVASAPGNPRYLIHLNLVSVTRCAAVCAVTVGLAAWLFRHVPFAAIPPWLLACLLAYAAGVFHRTWRIPC